MDLGASEHVTTNASHFQSLHKCVQFPISLPTGETHYVQYKGDIIITLELTLQNVYYIPSFHVNLLSVSRLTAFDQYTVEFTKHSASIYDKVLTRNHSLINMEKGLYLLQQSTDDSSFCGVISTQTWHNRVGHTSLHILKHILSKISPKHCDFDFHYPTCHYDKQPKASFPCTATRTSHQFDLLHMDVWRSFHLPLFMRDHSFLSGRLSGVNLAA